jgi:hypothetical protein
MVKLVSDDVDLGVMGIEMLDRQPQAHGESDDEVRHERKDRRHRPGTGFVVVPVVELGVETAQS